DHDLANRDIYLIHNPAKISNFLFGVGQNNGVGALINYGLTTFGQDRAGSIAVATSTAAATAATSTSTAATLRYKQLKQLAGIGIADANILGSQGCQFFQLFFGGQFLPLT